MDTTVVVQAVVLGLAQGAVYALIASGLTLIYAVTRHFNFAHGHFLAIGMYMSYALFTAYELDPYLSFFIVAPAMFILGLFIFRFLLQPLVRGSPLTTLIMLYGLSLIIENVLLIIFGGQDHAVPTFLDLDKLYFGPIIMKTSLLVALLVSLVVTLGFYWLLRTTDFGRTVRAVAEKPESAALMGIKVRRVQLLVFALAFVLLAIAATCYIPMSTMFPTMGLNITLFAFVVITLGGMGNFLGALVGGLIIGVAGALSSLFWGVGLSATIPYAIFILVMLFRPQGLFGGKVT